MRYDTGEWLAMDILKRFWVSYYPSGRDAVELILCFDSGSPYTFIKRTSALRVGRLVELEEQERFGGLGGGHSKESIHLHVKLLQFWCRHWAYVVGDDVLEKHYDILVGHDFMQRYGIKLLPEIGDIEIDEARLSLARGIRLLREGKILDSVVEGDVVKIENFI